MPVVKQYHYPNISQRRIINFNAFFTACFIGWFATQAVVSLTRFFPYSHVLEILTAVFLIAHLTGNIFGRLLFWKIRFSRVLYIFSELLFCGFSGFILYKTFMNPGASLISFYMKSPVLFTLFLSASPFAAGIKNTYFLKVSCGIFFDEKKGAPAFIFLSFLGYSLGFIAALSAISFAVPVWAAAIPLSACFLSLFFIKAMYTPVPFFAQEIMSIDQKENHEVISRIRDDLFFMYLNFSYALTYTFFGALLLERAYGDLLYVKLSFLICVLLSLCIGYSLAALVRRPFLPAIYSEIIFPFAFLAYFLTINEFSATLSFIKILLLSAPLIIVFGATLRHSIQAVLTDNDQTGASKALNISIFILPVPILTSLSFCPFTERVFALSFYVLAAAALIIPGIFLAQRKTGEIRKGMYLVFCALSVPFFIIIHLYFTIPFSNKPFIERVSGYEDLLKINFTADYLDQTASVSLYNIPAFTANDLTIRSFKREIASLAFFADPDSDSVLFIDGTHRFFNNPVELSFLKAVRLDYFPSEWAGLIRLSETGSRSIPNIKGEVVESLRTLKKTFSLIVDIPNQYDQYTNEFRFSRGYYQLVKSRLEGKRIFAQTFDMSKCDKKYFYSAVTAFKQEFPHAVIFLFSEQIIIIGSDRAESIVINQESISRIKRMISSDPTVSPLFFNENHCLAYLFSADLSEIRIPKMKTRVFSELLLKDKETGNILPEDLLSRFETNHTLSTGLTAAADRTFAFYFEQGIKAYDKQFTLLKQIEKDEAIKDYESETTKLLELRRLGEYDNALRQYISGMIAFKEASFNEYAQLFEKNKQWDEAAKIYKAILILNPNNFNANYRMSVISLTLQDITSSFGYLQTAMKLQSDNPGVMHQMGVLLFSTQKYNEALEYLQKAIALKKYDAETYYYIGLCFEELNRIPESLDYYQQALVKDPQNQDITGALARLKEKNQKMQDQWKIPEQKNQNDVERGEDFPLPINKSAIDVRLKDDPQAQ